MNNFSSSKELNGYFIWNERLQLVIRSFTSVYRKQFYFFILYMLLLPGQHWFEYWVFMWNCANFIELENKACNKLNKDSIFWFIRSKLHLQFDANSSVRKWDSNFWHKNICILIRKKFYNVFNFDLFSSECTLGTIVHFIITFKDNNIILSSKGVYFNPKSEWLPIPKLFQTALLPEFREY